MDLAETLAAHTEKELLALLPTLTRPQLEALWDHAGIDDDAFAEHTQDIHYPEGGLRRLIPPLTSRDCKKLRDYRIDDLNSLRRFHRRHNLWSVPGLAQSVEAHAGDLDRIAGQIETILEAHLADLREFDSRMASARKRFAHRTGRRYLPLGVIARLMQLLWPWEKGPDFACAEPPAPLEPTAAVVGRWKSVVLADRLAAGEGLWHPRDACLSPLKDDDLAQEVRRGRNGAAIAGRINPDKVKR